MENSSRESEVPQPATPKSVNRRTLLKAGWILPAIAVTPLMNTASAMSTVDCNALLAELELHKQNRDRDAFNAVRTKLHENGCTF